MHTHTGAPRMWCSSFQSKSNAIALLHYGRKKIRIRTHAYTYKYTYAYVLGTLSRSFCSTVRLSACVGDGCQGCALACRSCWGMCTWDAIAFVLLDRQAGCVCWGRLSVSVSCGRQRNANAIANPRPSPFNSYQMNPDGRAVG